MGTFDIHIGQRMSNISATLSSFWRSFYGVLTQENFTRCVGASLTLYAIAKSEISEIRELYLKSGISNKTAYGCNAEFMVRFCTLMSHFYRTGPKRGLIPPWAF